MAHETRQVTRSTRATPSLPSPKKRRMALNLLPSGISAPARSLHPPCWKGVTSTASTTCGWWTPRKRPSLVLSGPMLWGGNRQPARSHQHCGVEWLSDKRQSLLLFNMEESEGQRSKVLANYGPGAGLELVLQDSCRMIRFQTSPLC